MPPLRQEQSGTQSGTKAGVTPAGKKTGQLAMDFSQH